MNQETAVRKFWQDADWIVRTHTPAALEAAGWTEAAALIRETAPLTDSETVQAAEVAVNAAFSQLRDEGRKLPVPSADHWFPDGREYYIEDAWGRRSYGRLAREEEREAATAESSPARPIFERISRRGWMSGEHDPVESGSSTFALIDPFRNPSTGYPVSARQGAHDRALARSLCWTAGRQLAVWAALLRRTTPEERAAEVAAFHSFERAMEEMEAGCQ